MSSLGPRFSADATPTGGDCGCSDDLYADTGAVGVIDALDPRTRLLTALVFAVVVVLLDAPLALAVALGLAAGLGIAARLPAGATLRKLAALDGFMVMTLVTLPFTVPGDPWLALAGLPASWEGTRQAIIILLKGNAGVLAVLALVGTMDAVVLGHAMARLGAPDKLVHVYLFTIRYLDVLNREHQRLRTAMKARAFRLRTDRHTWRSFGWLFGMLMVRSIERAERIVAAMRCRGFDGRLRPLREDRGFRRGDRLFALASVAGMALLVVVARL